MLPLLVKATAFLTSLNQVIDLGTAVLGVQQKRKPRRQSRRVTQPRKPRLRNTPMKYETTGNELSVAFAAAAYHLGNPPKKKQSGIGKIYTIGEAIRFSSGHDVRIVRSCFALVSERLENKSASQWLIENGVPASEVKGLKGMANVRIWKSLWLEKLAAEFKGDETVYTFTYPF